MNKKGPVALIILDGFGLSGYPEGDATKAANTDNQLVVGELSPCHFESQW